MFVKNVLREAQEVFRANKLNLLLTWKERRGLFILTCSGHNLALDGAIIEPILFSLTFLVQYRLNCVCVCARVCSRVRACMGVCVFLRFTKV